MKKIIASLLLLVFFMADGSAQTSNNIRKQSLGFSFIANDFESAKQIRSSSLATVVRNKTFLKSDNFDYGIALNYIKGVTPHIDLAANLGATFSTELTLPGKPNAGKSNLVELDASGHFKMLSEGARFNPYLIAGIGVSKYTNVIGAILPLGGGFQLKVGDEIELHTQFQYRIPVTTEANDYHFQVNFGVSTYF